MIDLNETIDALGELEEKVDKAAQELEDKNREIFSTFVLLYRMASPTGRDIIHAHLVKAYEGIRAPRITVEDYGLVLKYTFSTNGGSRTDEYIITDTGIVYEKVNPFIHWAFLIAGCTFSALMTATAYTTILPFVILVGGLIGLGMYAKRNPTKIPSIINTRPFQNALLCIQGPKKPEPVAPKENPPPPKETYLEGCLSGIDPDADKAPPRFFTYYDTI